MTPSEQIAILNAKERALVAELAKEKEEVARLHYALVEILSQTGGGNRSHIGQDRAFSIAKNALANQGRD